MSAEDQKAFKLYGKVPGKNVLTKMQKVRPSSILRKGIKLIKDQDRKYFDSGDYMMNKAGVASAQAPGTAIPTPEGYAFVQLPAEPADILVSLMHSRLIPLDLLHPSLLPLPALSLSHHLPPENLSARIPTRVKRDCPLNKESE